MVEAGHATDGKKHAPVTPERAAVFRDALTREVNVLVSLLGMSSRERVTREDTIRRTKHLVKEAYPEASLELYGSWKTGLSLPSSDLDFVILGTGNTPKSEILHKIADQLQKQDLLCTAFLPSARVPVVKFQSQYGIRGDLTVSVPTWSNSVTLVQSLLTEHQGHHATELIMVLKLVLVLTSSNEVHKGGLSSYGLCLMVFAFIRRAKASGIDPSLGSMLTAFLAHYKQNGTFNPETMTVDITQNQGFRPGTMQCVSSKYNKSHWCVQDPLNAENNVTEQCFSMANIVKCFSAMHANLVKTEAAAVLPVDCGTENCGVLCEVVKDLGQFLVRRRELLQEHQQQDLWQQHQQQLNLPHAHAHPHPHSHPQQPQQPHSDPHFGMPRTASYTEQAVALPTRIRASPNQPSLGAMAPPASHTSPSLQSSLPTAVFGENAVQMGIQVGKGMHSTNPMLRTHPHTQQPQPQPQPQPPAQQPQPQSQSQPQPQTQPQTRTSPKYPQQPSPSTPLAPLPLNPLNIMQAQVMGTQPPLRGAAMNGTPVQSVPLHPVAALHSALIGQNGFSGLGMGATVPVNGSVVGVSDSDIGSQAGSSREERPGSVPTTPTTSPTCEASTANAMGMAGLQLHPNPNRAHPYSAAQLAQQPRSDINMLAMMEGQKEKSAGAPPAAYPNDFSLAQQQKLFNQFNTQSQPWDFTHNTYGQRGQAYEKSQANSQMGYNGKGSKRTPQWKGKDGEAKGWKGGKKGYDPRHASHPTHPTQGMHKANARYPPTMHTHYEHHQHHQHQHQHQHQHHQQHRPFMHDVPPAPTPLDTQMLLPAEPSTATPSPGEPASPSTLSQHSGVSSLPLSQPSPPPPHTEPEVETIETQPVSTEPIEVPPSSPLKTEGVQVAISLGGAVRNNVKLNSIGWAKKEKKKGASANDTMAELQQKMKKRSERRSPPPAEVQEEYSPPPASKVITREQWEGTTSGGAGAITDIVSRLNGHVTYPPSPVKVQSGAPDSPAPRATATKVSTSDRSSDASNDSVGHPDSSKSSKEVAKEAR